MKSHLPSWHGNSLQSELNWAAISAAKAEYGTKSNWIACRTKHTHTHTQAGRQAGRDGQQNIGWRHSTAPYFRLTTAVGRPHTMNYEVINEWRMSIVYSSYSVIAAVLYDIVCNSLSLLLLVTAIDCLSLRITHCIIILNYNRRT